MTECWLLIILALVALVYGGEQNSWTVEDDVDTHYTNEWAVQLPDRSIASNVARELSYENLGLVRGFRDIYLFRRRDTPFRSKRSADHHTRSLAADARV